MGPGLPASLRRILLKDESRCWAVVQAESCHSKGRARTSDRPKFGALSPICKADLPLLRHCSTVLLHCFYLTLSLTPHSSTRRGQFALVAVRLPFGSNGPWRN